jgi:uncharacterized protein (TIGR00251 family)
VAYFPVIIFNWRETYFLVILEEKRAFMAVSPVGAPAATKLKVFASPRASRDRLVGYVGDELKISLAAPPVEGAANSALARFLAKLLDLSPSQVQIASGLASRHKIAIIEGLSPDETQKKLEPLLAVVAESKGKPQKTKNKRFLGTGDV